MIVHTVSPLYSFYKFDMLGWWRRMALALPSVKPLWKAMRMLARTTELDAAKVCATQADHTPRSVSASSSLQ